MTSASSKSSDRITLFLIFFVIILTAEYFMFYMLAPDFADWQRFGTAKVLFAILNLFGLPITLSKDIITIGKAALRIVYECTGGFAFFIFSSATLAYPNTWKNKILAQIIGLVGIFILNIVRLVMISLVAYKSISAFHFIHKYLWQVTFPVVVILMFILWTKYIDRE